MRYHDNAQPQEWTNYYGSVYRCNHPVYRVCTLYKERSKGLCVIQQRYNKESKATYWSAIMVRCFLTTFDNPYNPYEQFEQWYQYDMDHGYNSSGLLMRLAQTSSQFTDNENAYEIEKAINKIVANDPANIYKKLKIEIKDDTGYAQSA